MCYFLGVLSIGNVSSKSGVCEVVDKIVETCICERPSGIGEWQEE